MLFTNWGAPEIFYKATHRNQVSSQPEECFHVPVPAVHATEEDPSSSLNLCPQPEYAGPSILEGRFWKGRVSGRGRAD